MSLRNLLLTRKLATSCSFRAAILSSEYRSSELWKERFQCPMLCNSDTVRIINNKIMAGIELSNLELDIFINVARPSSEDRDQLQEAASLLSKFRKSIMAHRLLPSTPHAVCRLFLDSECIPSLVTMLDDRVKFGIFPDFFSTNLLLDAAIESGQYALAAKTASLVMLQEEFGINQITDKLSLLSLVQYIESKTDFQNWPACDSAKDPMLLPRSEDTESGLESLVEEEPKAEKPEVGDDEEDEDDAEYIRVPFLRNPYFDNHFDVKTPRIICGKSFSALSRSLSSVNPDLSLLAELSGCILQGLWDEASAVATKCKASKIQMGTTKGTLQHFIENSHELEAPSEEQRKQLLQKVEALSDKGPSFLVLAKKECENLSELETVDISELKSNIEGWMKLRLEIKQAEVNKIKREQLIAEISAKKEELKRKEDYLYFYDKLKKSKITRIEYN